MSLSILYQDADYVAVYKPAHLLVHRSRLDAGETRFCLQMLRDQLGVPVHPCHRLDKPTSGILLFAFETDGLRAFQDLLEKQLIEKEYIALVRGWTEPEGTIDHPLTPEKDFRHETRVKEPQAAKTLYTRLSQTEIPVATDRYPTSRYSLLRLNPQSGRKHQLRRHLAHIRHPIVGDTRHGDGVHNRIFREHFNAHRLMLVATRLTFPHPMTQEFVNIRTKPDEAFLEILTKILIFNY